jgi:hypothetical protein
MGAIRAVIEAVLGGIRAFWDTNGQQIMAIVGLVWDNIKTVIEVYMGTIFGVIKAVMQLITGDWEGAWETIKGVFQGIWDGITRILGNYLEIMKNLFTIAWQTIEGPLKAFWGGIQSFIGGVWDGIVIGIKGSINTIIMGINSFIGSINAISIPIPRVDIGDFHLGGGSIDFPDIPTIPLLDSGGIITGPTLAAMALNGRPEAVVPLNNGGGIIDYDRMASAFVRALRESGLGFNIDGQTLARMVQPYLDQQVTLS